MTHYDNPLRLNVGFIVQLPVGSSREFNFDYSHLYIQPDLNLNNLVGFARITRTPQGLLTQVKMRATVAAECARCLTNFQQLLEVDFTELYAFSPRTMSESGLILPESGYIDLGPLVREYMILEMPINPICSPDCKGLCPICGEKIDSVAHHHGEDTIDPRLSVLKDLL